MRLCLVDARGREGKGRRSRLVCRAPRSLCVVDSRAPSQTEAPNQRPANSQYDSLTHSLAYLHYSQPQPCARHLQYPTRSRCPSHKRGKYLQKCLQRMESSSRSSMPTTGRRIPSSRFILTFPLRCDQDD